MSENESERGGGEKSGEGGGIISLSDSGKGCLQKHTMRRFNADLELSVHHINLLTPSEKKVRKSIKE